MSKPPAQSALVKTEVWLTLRRLEDRILQEWEQTAKTALPSSVRLSRLALRDSFPQIIDALADALKDTADAPRLQAASSIHAHERAFLTEFSIEQVILEYNLLREIVFKFLQQETRLSPQESQAIRRTFDQGVMKAAQEFFRVKSAHDTVTRAESLLVAHRLQTIQMITEVALTYASDIDRLLSEILNMISTTLAVDTCSIFLLTNGGDHFAIRAAHGLEEKVDPNLRIPSNRGVAGHAIEVLHPIIVPDLTNVETASPILRPSGVTSLMVVPLKIERRAIGVIQVGSLRRRDFTADEQAHMQIVADRVAIAVDHARLYAQVQKDNEILQKERELRERFVAALTHDLKNPLTSAMYSLDLLARREDDRALREKIRAQIRNSLARMNQMIEDMLDTERVHAGRPIPLHIREFDLASMARDVGHEFETTRGRPVRVSAKDALTGYWDPSAVRRILDNLLTNALKYGGSENPIELTLTRSGEEARISVHNEGNPIAESELKELFNLFERGQAAIKGGQRGWGIGLPLVRGIAEAHRGHVSVKSSAEEGTTFTVTLPLDCRPQLESGSNAA